MVGSETELPIDAAPIAKGLSVVGNTSYRNYQLYLAGRSQNQKIKQDVSILRHGGLRDCGPRRRAALTAGDPDGSGTGEESVSRPLGRSPGAQIKFTLRGTFQSF
jgi:hypothetical protein